MKRRYEKIPNEKRKALIDVVNNEGLKIEQASVQLGIPYENAKAIFRVYRNEMRTEKCKHRSRPRGDEPTGKEEKKEETKTSEKLDCLIESTE